ncbi:protein kinase [Streptomyces sp. NPDC047315]|uniref:protein kinase n=1 Tax=Streptomyces sp. NPDC047315 TaxID=3155142 RepID=UPI0033CBC9BC
MEDYAGRVLADRYRLPLLPSDEYELVETRAFDTYSGQEVLVRQVPLPEVVDAEVVDPDAEPGAHGSGRHLGYAASRAARRAMDPAVVRAIEAARAAAQVPDHPRLDQVFDVFAEDGSLWIVSERVASRPLAALLAEKPLTPYRAAEIASDVLTALRVLHAQGWIHRNISARTVLVCDDGRVVLTGLASGAAEEALCGYSTVPTAHDVDADPFAEGSVEDDDWSDEDSSEYSDAYSGGYSDAEGAEDHGGFEPSAPAEGRTSDPGSDLDTDRGSASDVDPYDGPAPPAVPDVRSARAGAIAAYRAGARAAARVNEEQRRAGDPPVQTGSDPDWWARKPGEGAQDPGPVGPRYHDHVTPGPEDRQGQDDDSAPGHARLAGTWHDAPLPGHDGPRPLGAGGGLPATGPVAPDGGGPHHRPQRDSDPYGVRALPPASGGLPALPVARAGRPGGAPAPGPTPPPEPYAPHRSAESSWQERAGGGALGADARRQPAPASPPPPAPSAVPASRHPQSAAGWDAPSDDDGPPAYQGPTTPLAAERARQARIAIVGAVTERWAPEQAGPVHENWQLAAPVGPATDLWALGALLYRAVQGHAPYPEENAAELVQLVCSEPPAFAEECGPLRPVVESLLRQDPTERPDVEELRGWLRSLVRSAPEPEAGTDVVALPSGAGAATGGERLPILRRKGELVRRRRRSSAEVEHGRHRHRKTRQQSRAEKPRPAEKPRRERGPKSLGRRLLLLVLLLLAAAVAYAVLFMPKSGESGDRTAPRGNPRPTPGGTPDPSTNGGPSSPGSSPGSEQAQTSAPAAGSAGKLPKGYELRSDPEGFSVAVDRTWQRRPMNDAGQVRYADDDFVLIIVPGRDTVRSDDEDPLAYQRDRERELQPFRDSSWSSSSGLRRIEVGRRVMAEGEYTWQDGSGREVFVRNRVIVIEGRYHVVQVIGPSDRRDKVTEAYELAVDAYRKNG